MKDQENIVMYDFMSGRMFITTKEKVEEAYKITKQLNEEENEVTLNDLMETIKKEEEYQLWKKYIEMLGEEVGFRWRICGDIFYRSPWFEYLGIGINLRDVFFKGKKLEL